MTTEFYIADSVVTCECGAQTTVADPSMIESITCGVCGCKVHITQFNVHKAGTPPPSALLRTAEHGNLAERLASAVGFVREGKYTEAMELYESVLKEKRDQRDAFYGLGFCHYKLQNFKESYRLLRMASEMGHVGAEKLLPKVHSQLTALW